MIKRCSLITNTKILYLYSITLIQVYINNIIQFDMNIPNCLGVSAFFHNFPQHFHTKPTLRVTPARESIYCVFYTFINESLLKMKLFSLEQSFLFFFNINDADSKLLSFFKLVLFYLHCASRTLAKMGILT